MAELTRRLCLNEIYYLQKLLNIEFKEKEIVMNKPNLKERLFNYRQLTYKTIEIKILGEYHIMFLAMTGVLKIWSICCSFLSRGMLHQHYIMQLFSNSG